MQYDDYLQVPSAVQGDVTDSQIKLEGGESVTVAAFIESYFGFQYYFLGITAGAMFEREQSQLVGCRGL